MRVNTQVPSAKIECFCPPCRMRAMPCQCSSPLRGHIVDIYRRQACSHTRPVYIKRILFLSCSTYLPADSPVESQGKSKWIQSSCCLCYGCDSTFMSNWDTFVASDDTKVFRLRHRRRRLECSLTASFHSLKSDAFTSWSSLVFLWPDESRFFSHRCLTYVKDCIWTPSRSREFKISITPRGTRSKRPIISLPLRS